MNIKKHTFPLQVLYHKIKIESTAKKPLCVTASKSPFEVAKD